MNARRRKPSGKPRSERALACLLPEIYRTIQDAEGKKVSVAWVIRDTAKRYIAKQ